MFMKMDEIYVIYGDKPRMMVKEILSKIEIEKEIKKDALIGIKPNLVVAKPSTSGATTSPELVAGVIEYLQSKNYTNIVILEGSWIGDNTQSAFKICGYEDLSKKYDVPLIDLQKDKYKSISVNRLKLNICSKVTKLDYLINMPVLKGHCQTKITCALKNLKGCIPNKEKRRFHTMGLHKPIAYLNKAIKTDLIIVDGLMGDLDFEEGGDPVQMDRVIVGCDPVLIDSYVSLLMGYDPLEIEYIKIAEDIDVGTRISKKTQVCEINENRNTKKIPRSRKVDRLAKYVVEKDACSACFGSLIHALYRMDENYLLDKITEKIHIGQGYKGVKRRGFGVGACTTGFSKSVFGCPPVAKDIVNALMDYYIKNE